MNTCPICSGPMKVLFTGFYCPKDCDRKPATTLLTEGWRHEVLKPGDVIPEWGTRLLFCTPLPDESIIEGFKRCINYGLESITWTRNQWQKRIGGDTIPSHYNGYDITQALVLGPL